MDAYEVMQIALARSKAATQAAQILAKYPELLKAEPDLKTFVKLSTPR
jgi:hypothetical protein